MGEEKSGNLKIIDWEEAMNQVGGDKEFLNEVLQDLLQESNTAEDEIAQGIKDQDYVAVMKAAHRIKGSASYLCCEELRWYSWKLQDAGHLASQHGKPNKDQIDDINNLFDQYCSSLSKLRDEISRTKRK